MLNGWGRDLILPIGSTIVMKKGVIGLVIRHNDKRMKRKHENVFRTSSVWKIEMGRELRVIQG